MGGGPASEAGGGGRNFPAGMADLVLIPERLGLVGKLANAGAIDHQEKRGVTPHAGEQSMH